MGKKGIRREKTKENILNYNKIVMKKYLWMQRNNNNQNNTQYIKIILQEY